MSEKYIVQIPGWGDYRFKSWSKSLTGVDKSKTTGYAFIGDWLTNGKKYELEDGTFILQWGTFGSRKTNHPGVTLLRLQAGNLETLYERRKLNTSWALDVRDDIAKIIDEKKVAAKPLPNQKPFQLVLIKEGMLFDSGASSNLGIIRIKQKDGSTKVFTVRRPAEDLIPQHVSAAMRTPEEIVV